VYVKVRNVTNNSTAESWWTCGVEIEIKIRRRPAFYIVTFVLPSLLITALALCGACHPVCAHRQTRTGLFTPGSNSQERTERCTMGLTALLTMAVILLMVAEMMPKSDAHKLPLLG
jgi:nicotinic acetylcholine receptor